ncbi:MAG: radical SAM protein [Anaerotignum sp.]|nr:radical SAM protein [Anaerotignum sp.]
MRYSNYNLIISLGKDYILFNSKSKVICKFDQDLYTRFMSIIDYTPEEIEFFSNLGLIVDKGCDERKILELQFLDEIFDKSLNLTIMPTEQCNFRCKYCYEDFRKGKMTYQDQNKLCKYIRKNLHNFTNLYVSWFGGEPTLALDVIEALSRDFIASCESLKKIYSAGITTNGYLLTYEVFCKLLELKVRHFQVTIDGNREQHDRIKKTIDNQSTFDTVWGNLIDIKNKSHKKTFDITIRININKESIKDLKSIAQMLYYEFGDDQRFNFYFRPVGDWGGERVKEIIDYVFEPEQYSQIYQELAKLSYPLNYRMYFLELTRNIDICYAAARNSYVIGSDLRLYKCSVIFDNPLKQVGQIRDNGNIYLDNDKISKWILSGINASSDTVCKSCLLYGNCHNSACIADQVRDLKIRNCPHMKNSLKELLILLSDDIRYCVRYTCQDI